MGVSDYKPRRVWKNPLYHAVAENLATFLAADPIYSDAYA